MEIFLNTVVIPLQVLIAISQKYVGRFNKKTPTLRKSCCKHYLGAELGISLQSAKNYRHAM